MERRRRDEWGILPWAATRPKLHKARQMRRNPTRAEARLWTRLRGRQLDGFKFRRQHIIAGFIVDFYCPILRLAVEVDGPHHASQVEDDLRRTRRLETYGVRVVRVDAEEVMEHLDDVIEVLRDAIATCQRAVCSLPPSPLVLCSLPPSPLVSCSLTPQRPQRGKGAHDELTANAADHELTANAAHGEL